MANRNNNNFLRWDDLIADPTLLPQTQLAEPRIKCSQPILVPGETTSFYWNDTNNSVDLGDINLVNIKTYAVVAAGIGSIVGHIHQAGSHATGSLVCPNVKQGYYRLAIGGALYSNIVEVVTDAQLIKETAVFEFWDTRQVSNFLYPYTPEGFRQKFRLRYDRSPNKYFTENEQQVYLNGKERNIAQRSYNYFLMKIVEADEGMRDAVKLMLAHSNILVNGVKYDYRNESGINVTIEDEVLSSVEFEMKYDYFRVTC